MLVDQLIQECRDGTDEDETSDLSDAKILRALNRAQLKLVRLATRKYPAMLRRESITEGVSTRAVDLPEDAYAFTVNDVSVRQSGSSAWFPCYRAQSSQLLDIDDASSSGLPGYWDQEGSQIKLYPLPSNTDVRVRYQLRPLDLVVKQARITAISGQTLFLDAIGSELTTSIAQLKAFVNIIDGTTGVVKGTVQVNSVPSTIATALTVKTSSLDRDTVFGQTVSTALPDDITVDDYLCIANGTCVPTLFSDYADYLVLSAVVELRRAAGEDVAAERGQLDSLEDDLKAMWAGRAAGQRVARKSPYWGTRVPLSRAFRG